MGGLQNSENNSITVSQLTEIIKELLEQSLPKVYVEGEISNYRPSSTGHLYFTLKDENAAISAVMFKYKANSLTFLPQDGMKVKVKGQISVYAQRGTYQITVESMEKLGDGNLLLMIEQRKQRLASEGLFDRERKQRIPFFPNTIGVVTSPTGAALRDILQILERRNPKISVIIFPCQVQGADAADSIAQQIKIANEFDMVDVLIVGRGGGSLEDLLPFSEECVVRAIAESKIPTISAVGHEIDTMLSDYAADVRAPTPSAAAELASPILSDLENAIEQYRLDFIRSITTKIDSFKTMSKSFSIENMESFFRNKENSYIQRLDDAKTELINAIQLKMDKSKNQLALATNTIEQLNPRSILKRGFSIVQDENGKIISSVENLQEKQNVVISVADGKFVSEITKIQKRS
ncbi:MAG: exodeoxyribonuclease VII large subunit [Treponemataceae bacterium]|nr:exodeoxyribonuclease VII large subunit [Spirochaetales bacterium]MDY6031526.1 exodeoxyribonuclease VII large subunit [Treponemataceae bacterium]